MTFNSIAARRFCETNSLHYYLYVTLSEMLYRKSIFTAAAAAIIATYKYNMHLSACQCHESMLICVSCEVWYGIAEFNVPLNTV